MSLQESGQRFGDDAAHPQQRILNREASLGGWIRQHRQHRRDDRYRGLSRCPLGGLRADCRVGIREQLLHYRIGDIHPGEHPRTAKTAGPASALAQFPSAIQQRDLARYKTQSLFSGSCQIARGVEEDGLLHVVAQSPKERNVFDAYRPSRDKARQRLARCLRREKNTPLVEKQPDSV